MTDLQKEVYPCPACRGPMMNACCLNPRCAIPGPIAMPDLQKEVERLRKALESAAYDFNRIGWADWDANQMRGCAEAALGRAEMALKRETPADAPKESPEHPNPDCGQNYGGHMSGRCDCEGYNPTREPLDCATKELVEQVAATRKRSARADEQDDSLAAPACSADTRKSPPSAPTKREGVIVCYCGHTNRCHLNLAECSECDCPLFEMYEAPKSPPQSAEQKGVVSKDPTGCEGDESSDKHVHVWHRYEFERFEYCRICGIGQPAARMPRSK